MSAAETVPQPLRFMVPLVRVLDRLPRRALAAVCLMAVVAVGLTDYETGEHLSFSIFYLLPVMAAGSRSVGLGLRVSITSVAVWCGADLLSRNDPYLSPLMPVWNTVSRFLVMCIVVALLAALQWSLFQERRLSRRDELTGLANFRAFYEVADAEIRRLARTARPLTIVYIDIDNFKRLNDRFGHAVGDEVIVATARLLVANMRDVDTIARIGGDEFALLLPETEALEAKRLLERLHGRLLEEAGIKAWGIGYSAGAVTFAAPGVTVDAMVADADGLMYEVKRSGKNAIRCVVASQAGTPAFR